MLIPRDERSPVRIEERFLWGDDAYLPGGAGSAGLQAGAGGGSASSQVADRPAPTPRQPQGKAILERFRWQRIAEPARREFNLRLREAGLPPGQWRAGEALLAPHFGKELTLLAWAVEDDDGTLIPSMIANWSGLAPEERWWLYTTVNATSLHAEHGHDRGWRKAIKIAFAENPSAGSPATFMNPYDRPVQLPMHGTFEPAYGLRPVEGTRRKKAPREQGRLL